MNSATYNLNEKVGSDYFKFTLDNFEYHMTYPTSKEIMQISEVADSTTEWQEKILEAQDKLVKAKATEKAPLQAEVADYTEKAKLAQTTFLDWCMEYIEPQVKEAPNIKETLMNKNVKFLMAFMKMVQAELSE